MSTPNAAGRSFDEGFWRGRRVFVTGATGMVGSWLVKALLEAEAIVVGLVRDADPQSELFRSDDIERITVVNGALEDYATLERAICEHEIETVFHLAAQPIVTVALRMPLQTLEANVRGTYNLLEACRRHRDQVGRIVVASSDKAYGEQPELPYTEAMPLRGVSPYEVSKSCADLIAYSYSQTYDLPVAITRCGNIFGGGDLNWSRIVPGTIRACLMGQRPVVRSDGTYVRDYVYVRDVISGYLRAAERLGEEVSFGQALNLGPERPMTVLELISEIQKLMSCEELTPVIENTARGEIRSQYLCSTLARDLLGWRPSFSIEQGLRATIAWYEDFFRRNLGVAAVPSQ